MTSIFSSGNVLQDSKEFCNFAMPKYTQDREESRSAYTNKTGFFNALFTVGRNLLTGHTDCSRLHKSAVVSRKNFFWSCVCFGEPGNDSRFSVYNAKTHTRMSTTISLSRRVAANVRISRTAIATLIAIMATITTLAGIAAGSDILAGFAATTALAAAFTLDTKGGEA